MQAFMKTKGRDHQISVCLALLFPVLEAENRERSADGPDAAWSNNNPAAAFDQLLGFGVYIQGCCNDGRSYG